MPKVTINLNKALYAELVSWAKECKQSPAFMTLAVMQQILARREHDREMAKQLRPINGGIILPNALQAREADRTRIRTIEGDA